MSKVRTQEELIDTITAELSWRKKEISLLLLQIKANEKIPEKHRVLVRSAIVLLYSHWEGFIKQAAITLLEYIVNKRHSFHEIIPSFQALSLRSQLKIALNEQNVNKFLEVLSVFSSNVPTKFRFNFESAIETDDNLSSAVLKRIVVFLSLDYSLFQTKEKLIDNVLLHYRNNIVHGKDFTLGHKDFIELHSEIMQLIEQFRTQVENSALNKSFLKKEISARA